MMAKCTDLVALEVEVMGLNRDTYAGSEIFQGLRRCQVCFNPYQRQSWSYWGKSGQEVTVCETCHKKAMRLPA